MIYEKYRLQNIINNIIYKYRIIQEYFLCDIFIKDYNSPNSIMRKYVKLKPLKYHDDKTKDLKIVWTEVIYLEDERQMIKEILFEQFINVNNYYPQSITLPMIK